MDTNKTIKCKFKDLLKSDIDYTYFFDCIKRANDVVFRGYYFIRSYFLYLFNIDEQFPEINEKFIMTVFNVITKKSQGPKNNHSKGKVIIVNETKISLEEEITRSLIQIINVFSAKVNGLRKYKKHIKKECK